MLTVNGVEIQARDTLLETCRAAGATIYAFCHDPRLSPGGHCRACLVEMDGRVVASCTTSARDGARVETETERLRAYRRDLGELMALEASPARRVGKALADWGVPGGRYARNTNGRRRGDDRSHPYLVVQPDRCILCRRCVRACEEIQGQFVLGIEGRGGSTALTWSAPSFAATACVSCGACVATCPAGAIEDRDRERFFESLSAPSVSSVRTVQTTCGYCGVGCQLEVAAGREGVLKVEGVANAAVNRGHLCVKGRYAHAFVRHPDRLTTPLVRRHGRLVPASWDEALDLVARELGRLRGRVAGLSSARCTNEENYLFQKWMRGGLGTHDVDCCARVCHAPSAEGMREAFGTGAATASFDDIEVADLLWITGANVTESHPVIGARIKQAVLRGARLIVVDPRRTELASMADVHLQNKPGTNVPLLNSVANALLDLQAVRRDFIDARTEGWARYEPFIRCESPERHRETTGIAPQRVREAARWLARAERPLFLHGLGVTEHTQGSEAVTLLCNLALLRGAVGRPGTGVSPLRGQNNVQGAADMGCQPDLLTGYGAPTDPETRARFERLWGRPLPRAPGRRLSEMWAGARAKEIAAMVILGEDVLRTDPDTPMVREALDSLEFLVVQEIFLSDTAAVADVVLPGASFLEKDGTFTNGERRIQKVRRVVAPPGEARADWEILLDLMKRTGWPQPFHGPAEIWSEIARVAPLFAGVSEARLERGGLQWPVPSAQHPGTALLHEERFARGLGKLTAVTYEPSPELVGPLILVTGRRLEHYNAGSMTRRTENLVLAPHDTLDIHPEDATRRGIQDGCRVKLTSRHGETWAVARISSDVRPGSLFLTFHHPETRTNALIGDGCDRRTGCPEYKVVGVEVERAGA